MTTYQEIESEFKKHLPAKDRDFVLVCIGTDRCTGDAVGPFVGEFLTELNLPRTYIYGTIQNPVMALNLEKTVQFIKEAHPDAFVIAIDAAVGEEKEIGKIIVRNQPIRPGFALGKNLPAVGDVSIIAIVSKQHPEASVNFKQLSSTRLLLVLQIAKAITSAIENTITEHFTPAILPLKTIEYSQRAKEKRHKKRPLKERILEKLNFLKNKERIS